MNLLVKKIGLVFLPALFFACEEPTELGASLNPNSGALSTHYIELPVTTSQVRSDSLNTALRSARTLNGTSFTANTLLGRLQDQDFGITKATVYANMGAPVDSTVTLGTQARLDSAKIRVVWNRNGLYGQGFTQTQRYAVHQLLSPIAPTSRGVEGDQGIEWLRYQYFIANKQELGDQLGELTLNLGYAANQIDTATALSNESRRTLTLNLPLGEEDFANRIFRDFRSDPMLLRTQDVFEQYFKGIALVPSDENSYLLSLDLANASSGLTLYYTQGTEQYTLHLPFVPSDRAKRVYTNSSPASAATGSYPVYFGIETDRSNTGLANSPTAGHFQDFEPLDGRVYYQAITGLLPKVEYDSVFKAFMLLSIEPDEQLVLNRAVLEFDSLLAGAERQPLPPANNGNQLYFVDDLNQSFPASSPFLRGGAERAMTTLGLTYRTEEDTIAYIQSDVALSLEEFMKTGQNRYLQALLYPAEGQIYSPNRFVIRPDQVKLKIWYTKLKGSNL
jgi:hypothetical protein